MMVAPRYTLLTPFSLFKLFKLLYTALTVACIVPIYILLGKVRTLLERADELLVKMWGEW